MKGVVNQRLLMAALMGGLAVMTLLLTPLEGDATKATAEGWIDQLTGFVVVERGLAEIAGEGGTYDPYWGQLHLVRNLYERGDRQGTYVAMNRFMDMLEAREGGISAQAADAIWDYCYQVTPPAFHDVKRHKEWWDKTVDWDKFFWEE